MANKYVINFQDYADLARQAAAEGIVLLENKKQVLPLQEGEKVSVFGRIQFDYYKSGTGSGGLVNTNYVIGILDALKEEKLFLNQTLMQTYETWMETHPFDFGQGWAQEPWNQEEMPLSDEIVQEASEFSDTAVVVIGRTAGEDRDAVAEKGSYLLTDMEEDMLRKVRSQFAKVIVLLNVGNIIDMKWVEEISPDAVLYVWQGGMEGGHGVADVLMGRVNPCGKLADTIAENIEDYPSTKYFGGEEGDAYVEDIYVGYRYFETFAKDKVLYPFGYGLSYTTFSINPIFLERKSDRTELKIRVTNQGAYSGKEVVQVYVKAPQGMLGKPFRSLVAFGKTQDLKSGDTEELAFTISDEQISSYDDGGKTGHRSAYVLEEGIYEVYVGSDVRNCVLAGAFTLKETRVVMQLSEAAAPAEAFQRLVPFCNREDGACELSYEDVPIRTQTQTEHRDSEEISCLAYTDDKEYRLEDVYDKRVDMQTFLAQLSDADLCHLANGEGMCSPKVTEGTASAFGGLTEKLREFGIPCGCCSDGPSGIRMDSGAKAFSLPGGTCLACTFSEELNEQLFAMEGAELRKNRIDTLLGPGMNIHRNPLNGRNFEYFSEDPYVTGKIAAAQLRGMHTYGVTGTIKHFAVNNQEHNRRRYNAVISERALREIYLKGFEIAVKEGGAYSVMTTYGAVNGVWTAGSYDLCTQILRKEWGFDGMVMTDWWADINEEGTKQSQDQMSAMVKAQNDVYMVVGDTTEHMGDMLEQLADGRLKRGVLVRNAENICHVLMRSQTMTHFLGRTSQEELEAQGNMTEGNIEEKMECIEFADTLELSVEGICTDRGSEVLYGIKAAEEGEYELLLQVKIDASEIAQVPISVFVNGTLTGSITLNGTNGNWIDVKISLGYFPLIARYVKLYFAQGGMQIASMKVMKK